MRTIGWQTASICEGHINATTQGEFELFERVWMRINKQKVEMIITAMSGTPTRNDTMVGVATFVDYGHYINRLWEGQECKIPKSAKPKKVHWWRTIP